MAFDLCVIPVSTVPYLSALQTRQFSMTEITAHLVSEKLTRDQCRSMTPEIFASSYGSSSHALHVRSSVSSEINLAITSSVSVNAPSGYTIVIQGYLNDRNSQIVLGVCVSDEPIVADASLRMFMNIEETNNVFRLSADFDGMVTQGLLDDILSRYVTTDTEQDITGEKRFTESNLKIGSDTIKHYSLKHGQEFIIGTQTASTNEWTGVSVQDALYDGMCINFYLPYAGTSKAATLTLTMADGTTTAAIPVKYRGNNNVTTTFPVGSIIQLTYCENKVIGASTITGWLADSNYATSSPTIYYERNRIIGRVVAGSTGLYALQPSLLVDRDGNKYVSITTSSTAHASGTPKTCTTLGFYPESILTSDTSYESENTAKTMWRTYTLTVKQCFGTSSLTAYRPVYLVCTFNRNDGKFYLDTTQWWAQTIPQQENGKLYIFLGITATTETFTLDSIHPILCYKNGRVQEVTYSSLVLGSAAFREAVDIMPDASSGELPSSVAIKGWVAGKIQNASDYLQSIIPSGDAADKNVDTSIVNESSGNLPTVEAVTGWVSSQLDGYAQSGDIPTVGNATITIQKRSGTSAGNFTTNATTNKTINLSLGAAADKEVDTSISSTSSTNLPTSSAVAEWVNAQTGNFVTLDTQQTITSTKTLHSGEFSTSLNILNIVVEHAPSSTSVHSSSATLAPEGLYADGVSFKNAYGRAADNYLVASVSGNGGYSELTGLGGDGFTFCYKGTNETDYHYPLRLNAGITEFDENQTLYLAKDTNTYLHVNGTTVSVKDYVERIAGSGSSKFVVADVNTLEPSQISSLTDYRQSGTSSDNPHYNSTNASFKFDVSDLPSNGTTFEVFIPLTTFVGSVQLVYGSNNYIYPIYFRGNDNVHCPTVPQGSVIRITFYDDAFYGDFYDLADFGDEHEAYVYVGKVPVDKNISDLYSFSGLVGIDRDTGKFSQLFTVNDTPNGFIVQSPRLRENSPIYACFQGDCFAAHPKVPFGNILRIHDEFYVQETLQIQMLPFTYYPFDDGDTVDAHVVVNTSSQSAYKYFQVDNCPVYIQAESNSVLIGNPPADVPARLIGFMCSGAENAGMIRLVENADVFYMSATVEFKDRVSFRTSTGEAAYIDSEGVYHGDATGIASTPSLSFSEATSGTTGGTLSVSVGGKTSSSIAISPVGRAIQPYVASRNSNDSYPLVFTSGITAGYKDLYTDNVNHLSYNPNSNTLTCPTFVGDLTGNASTATKATYLSNGSNDIAYAYYNSVTDRCLRPSVDAISTAYIDLGSSNYRWNRLYARYLGNVSYPITTAYITNLGTSGNPITSAYITNMYGTASKATADASGNTITSTYLKDVTIVTPNGADKTSVGSSGISNVTASNWPTHLRLTKGGGGTTDICLANLVASYLIGFARSTTAGNLSPNGAEGSIAILQVQRSSNSTIIKRGSLLSSYTAILARGLAADGSANRIEWTSGSDTVTGTWVALNYTGTTGGTYNYCMVLAIRIY